MTHPMLLRPTASPRLWGGTRLNRYLTRTQLPGDQPIGELWLAFDDNLIESGPFEGRMLGPVAAEQGARLVGTVAMNRYGARVPLLAKLIDAADRLSIQVHPDDAYALEHEVASGHLGKSEAWYILEAKPGSVVTWGWHRTLDPATVRKAVADGTLEHLMNRVPVAAGDVVYNPAGTVHAIGAGVFLFEIQQASDLTYRLYDFQRRGPDGSTRALHLDQALAVADLSAGERAKVARRPGTTGWNELIRCEHFVLERLQLSGAAEATTRPTSLQILCSTTGDFEVASEGGRVRAGVGQAVVLPATLGAYTLAGEAEVLRSFLPASVDGG